MKPRKDGNYNWDCPKCQKSTVDFPAISRRDNRTEICSQCGVDEAMADHFGKSDQDYQAHFDNFYNNGERTRQGQN